MSRKRASSPLVVDAASHASVAALLRCLPHVQARDRVEVLKERGTSRGVYRLSGPGGRSIVAKLGSADKILRERYIYESVLPAWDIRGLECFGALKDHAGSMWIFIEGAQGAPFDRTDPLHRRLAGQWFARLHTSEEVGGGRPSLPANDMARHRASLDGVTGRLAFLRKADRVLPPEGLATIAGLEARLRNMQRLWPALEQASAAVPRTIVHGDVQAKNMVVSPAGELLVFDWEHCGFGDPSRDLDRCLDLNVYLETAAERWPWLTREHVERMVSVGDALRLIDAVAWDACRLETPWWGRALRHLEYYSQELGAVEMDCLG